MKLCILFSLAFLCCSQAQSEPINSQELTALARANSLQDAIHAERYQYNGIDYYLVFSHKINNNIINFSAKFIAVIGRVGVVKWTVNESTSCPVAQFVPLATTFNAIYPRSGDSGNIEVTFAYRKMCEPNNLHVVYHDNNRQINLIGQTETTYNFKRFGGAYITNPTFLKAPIQIQNQLITVFNNVKVLN